MTAMRFWASPFPMDPALAERLFGVGSGDAAKGKGKAGKALLLYDPPHTLLATPSPHASAETLRAVLRHRLRHAEQGLRPVAIGRIASLSEPDLRRWLSGEPPQDPPISLPDPEPIAALLTLAVLDACPDLLEAYLNLELKADLLGGRIDNDYIARLRRAACRSDANQLLAEWHRTELERQEQHIAIKSITKRLGRFRDRDDRNQRKLERLLRAEASIDELMTENLALKDRLAEAIAECEQLRENLAEERNQAEQFRQSHSLQEQQFHQIQDELEQYYLQHHRYRWLCQEVQKEMRRAEFLLLEGSER